ncbi:MAG TPA: reverse transcriptase-like protein, partial [Ktedonobacterales bacterium]|nr:reverse transcriptase-like protein [Ktedonobacterales bacterium]
MQSTSEGRSSTEMDNGYFDGACEPVNPHGAMGWGWTLDRADGTHTEGYDGAPAARGNTNNIAEYRAALALLLAYAEGGGRGPLRVYGDSMLVVRQVTDEWACNAAQLQALRERVWEVMASIPGGVSFQHVPREQNAAADALSVAALRSLGVRR